MTSTCTFIVQATDAGGWSQVKLPIVSDYVAPASTKLPLRAPVDSVAAPGFSGEGESCRTVIVRTDGPVPAKVCWKSGFVVHCCQPIIAKPTLWPVTQADYQQASNSTEQLPHLVYGCFCPLLPNALPPVCNKEQAVSIEHYAQKQPCQVPVFFMQYPGGSFRLFCTKLGLLDPLGLPGNSIRTAKYTVLSFLPVNLFQQFTRVANMYFLFIAFLQLIPGLSPTSWVTTVGPLCFVLFINGIKVSSACSPSYSHACQASTKCQALLLTSNSPVTMIVT